MKSIKDIPPYLPMYKIAGSPDEIEGAYKLKHHSIHNYIVLVIVSSGLGWEHVSVSLRKVENGKEKEVERTPTWAEMCWLKDLFWNDEETVVQYHPPKSEYVNNHKYCLHLWRPTEVELPRPLPEMVGIR